MSEPVIEVHVPLAPSTVPDGEYPYPYLETIESFLFQLEGEGRGEMYGDGEEYDGEYLFFLADADEDALLDLARELSALPGVPPGTYAIVSTTDTEEWGVGRRVELAA
ncbi:hypothetical protein AB0O16_14510 [Microbacterium sp. NPDC089180]|uniref:hypothetical protein n=1 Tax=unclassified Microbacterium TaxID=2609290 RepID=UPI00343B1414